MWEAFTRYLLVHALEPSMIVQNLVTSVDVLLLFSPRTARRDAWRQRLWQAAALFLALVVLNGAWEVVVSGPNSFYLTHLLLLIGYAWAEGRLDRDGWRSCAVTIALFYAVEVCMIALSSTLTPQLISIRLEAVLRNATVLLTAGVAWLFRRFDYSRFPDSPNGHLALSVIIAAATATLCAYYGAFYRNTSSANARGHLFATLAFAAILTIDLVAYYLGYTVRRQLDTERRLQAENYSLQNNKRMLQLSQQNIEDMRKLRHDLKNHYGYMDVLLKKGRYKELLAYFEEMQASTVEQLTYMDFGNENISAILNLERSKAKNRGIELDCRVIVERELPFGENDICSILTNLIDNALEACGRQKIPNATVEVGINQKPSTLYLCVVNPVDESLGREKLLSLKTTKGDVRFHGYGSRIVNDIAKKYNGQVRRTVERGKYIVDVMLDLRWNEADGAK